MKNLMDTLLVTIMVLFTFTSYSQKFGCNGEPFDDPNEFIENSTINSSITFPSPCGVKVSLSGGINQMELIYTPNENEFTIPFLGYVEVSLTIDGGYQINNDEIKMSLMNGLSEVGEILYDNSEQIYYIDGLNIDMNNQDLSIIVTSTSIQPSIEFVINYIDFQQRTASITNNLENSFKVYSYDNLINVKTNEFKDYTLQVYNMGGMLIIDKTTRSNFKEKLSDSGIYILKLQFENEVLTQKLVIQ